MLELTIINETLSNGGITYNLHLNASLAGLNYFAVAMYPDHEKIVPVEDFDINTVRDYLLDNIDLLKDRRNSLGTWHNTDNNMIYLDISRTISNKETAIDLGKKHKQLAIFDLANLEEITL